MSEIDEFKSDNQETEKVMQNLKDAISRMPLMDGLGFVRSNLAVVNNLRNTYSDLNSCNTEFIDLVGNNADFIPGLQEIYASFDADLSTKMGR